MSRGVSTGLKLVCVVTAMLVLAMVASMAAPTITIKMNASAGGFSPGSPNPATGKPITMLRVIADEYQKLHPGVKIEFTEDGGREGLVAQMAGDVAADVENAFNMTWDDIGKGWWVNLDPYLAKPNPYVQGNKQWLDVFLRERQDLAMADGHLYSLSTTQAVSGFFYNKAAFAKAGIKETPATWSQFIDDQAKLKEAGYIPCSLFIEHATGWMEGLLLTELYDDIAGEIDLDGNGVISPEENARAVKKGYYAPDNPRYREIWRLMKEWAAYWSPQAESAWVPEQSYKMFTDQKTAIHLDNQQFAAFLNSNPDVKFDWGVFGLPQLTKEDSQYARDKAAPNVVGAVAQWGITKTAVNNKDLDQVVDWLMYVTAPQNISRILDENPRWIPNIKGVEAPGQLKDFDKFSSSQLWLGRPSQTLTAEYLDQYNRLTQDFLYGNMSLDQFLQTLGKDMNAAADQLIADNGWKF